MRRFTASVIAATMVSLVLAGAPAARADTGGHRFYVSLGDSVAAGFQPSGQTRKGYVDRLVRRVRETIPLLRTRKFACVGETSRSLITGVGSECEYAAGSQLNAAVRFLERHRDRVPFITIDIGSNDLVNRCLDFETGTFDQSCVAALVTRLRHRLPRIVDALRAAAGPGVPILGMTYYNPFLGIWGFIPHSHALARGLERSWEVFNAGLTAAYETAGAVVADVARPFRIHDFSHTVLMPGRGRVPINVALACRWTWFCSQQYFGDPHPTSTGYRIIARSFYRELRSLL